jgi:carbon starvation protein CstA
MLSVRHDGASLPDLIGKYLGQGTKKVMLVFTVILLILVGAVFVYSPSLILGDIAGDGSRNAIMIWAAIIFAYYLIATILPIDKIIGKIYPLFAISLIFMAIALMVGLFIKWPAIPEIWDGLANRGPELGVKGQPIFPCLFITIACGAISGFHATQSPLMARCMKNEKLGRPIFYGSMITEGLVALIWATISSYFFFAGGAEEVGSSLSAAAPTVVTAVSKGWLGVLGGILAILGVVAAPITTGDTALRSCRLIVADAVHYDQKPVRSRLALCVPIFLATALILWFNIANEDGFNVIWRYFGWANQTLSIFTLWALTVYLARNKGALAYMITLIPALLMTSVCTTYICTAKIGFNLPMDWNIAIGTAVAGLSALLFGLWFRSEKGRKS